MKDLVKKVAVGISTGALIAQSLIVPALANITVVVSNNGEDTNNSVSVGQANTQTVTQTNTANVSNTVNAVADTGHNETDDTVGSVSIDTGDAETEVTVSNTVNSNEASVGCGGCPGDVKVQISGNVEGSDNDVDLELVNSTWVDQDSQANLNNKVNAKSNSGYNKVNDVTSGNVDVQTGKASSTAKVTNQANANVAHVSGSDDSSLLELLITNNGEDSDNTIKANLANLATVWQTNFAGIENDVEVDAVTGKNSVNDVAGGYVKVDTGEAFAGATVDNEANFNWADVEDCCEFDGLVKVSGNGEETTNDVNLGLVNSLFADQQNTFGCDQHGYGWMELFGGWRKDDECNDVSAYAGTGYNEVDDTTGYDEDPSIDTGDATTEVEVSNEGNANVFSSGDAVSELPDWETDGSWNWLVWVLAGHNG